MGGRVSSDCASRNSSRASIGPRTVLELGGLRRPPRPPAYAPGVDPRGERQDERGGDRGRRREGSPQRPPAAPPAGSVRSAASPFAHQPESRTAPALSIVRYVKDEGVARTETK